MGSSSNKLIIAILLVAALAVGFWMVLVSPKREESKKLSAEAGQLEASVTEARGRLAQAEVAKRAFPADYRQLVVLGKAVPQGDETSSLLVELGKVSEDSKVRFNSITLEEGSGGEESAAPPPTESAATVPPRRPPRHSCRSARRSGRPGSGFCPTTSNSAATSSTSPTSPPGSTRWSRPAARSASTVAWSPSTGSP
jgi:hypothetical protein